MKLVTLARNHSNVEEVGVLKQDGAVLPVREAGFPWASMNDLILGATPADLASLSAADGETLPPEEVRLLSPIPRPIQDVLCMGLNYTEHAAEASLYSKEAFSSERATPIFFSKRVSYSQGTGAPIPAHAGLTQRLDYEAELAVILGKDAVNVAPEDVEQYIFGYTVVNDVSARDLQTAHKQWYFGKSLDGFTPMGPCIVTADEIPYPPKLKISATLNGELRQNSTTDMLIHSISDIVSLLSRGMTLTAGTIIATGTPKGVIMGMEDPHFMQKGDVIACAIEGIGTLTNTVE